MFGISWQTLWKVFFFALFVGILYLSRHALGMFFVAVVVSLGLDPLVGFLEKKGIHRLLGVLIVFLGLFFIISVAAYFIIPIFIIEVSSFLKDFHDVAYSVFGIGLPENLIDALLLGRDKVFEFLSNSDISITQTLSSFFATGVFALGAVIISFYLSIEKEGTERFLRVILPDEYEPPILKIFGKFKLKIRRWLVAQIGISLAVGLIVGIGLWVLGVKYAFVLGILAAVFEVVPVIGPILVGAISFIVTVPQSIMLGVYTLIFFFFVQQLENHILTPLIVGRTMRVHPIVVILSLFAGGSIAGFLGIILAVPIAVILQEVFDYLAERKTQQAEEVQL